MAYINTGADALRGSGCPFCAAQQKTDADGLIVYRGVTSYALLNLFQYNSGHLLVCPYRHIATYDQATSEEVAEIGAITQTALRVLRQVSNCDGFNIGMNLGKAAGAGVDDHLHVHVIPRWNGDTNFMSTVGSIRVIPEDLYRTRDSLRPCFRKYYQED